MDGSYFDRALLVSCIDGLGREVEGPDGISYCKDADTMECLKDVCRFLRLDHTEEREAALLLGKCNVVLHNLVPLLKAYPNDHSIVYHTLKVIVVLTMPGSLGKKPQEMMSMLHAVKAAFTDSDILGIVTSLCHVPLTHFPQLTKEDRGVLQLFLTFIRNLLWIPDATDYEKSLGKAHYCTLQADFLNVALDEHVLELVVSIAQHIDEAALQGEAPIVVQLLSDLYQVVEPQLLQKTSEDILLRTQGQCAFRHGTNQGPDLNKVAKAEDIRMNDRHGVSHIPAARPSTVRSKAHVPGHILLPKSGDVSLYVRMVAGAPLHKSVLKNAGRDRASQCTAVTGVAGGPSSRAGSMKSPQMLARIKIFTSKLLQGALEAIMLVIRDEAKPGLNICSLEPITFLHFFRLATWFLQYCRYTEESHIQRKGTSHRGASSMFQSLSSLLSWDMINLVCRTWLVVADTDGPQKSSTEWDLQESAIKTLRELVSVLDLAFHYGSGADREAADAIQRQLLHDDSKDAGILNRILRAMKGFKKHDKRIAKQGHRETRAYAIDMIKTLHIVLRVYERLCKTPYTVKGCERLPKQSTVGNGDDERKGGAEGPAFKQAKRSVPSERGLKDSVEQSISCVSGRGTMSRLADNAKLDFDDKEQGRASGIVEDVDMVGALTRQGSADSDEQVGALEGGQMQSLLTHEAGVMEQRLHFGDVLKAVGHPEVLKLYMFVLERHRTLDGPTVHATAIFLTRLCSEIDLEPMLYQLKYLRQFHALLTDEHTQRSSAFKELLRIASKISANVIERLDPEPVGVPQMAVDIKRVHVKEAIDGRHEAYSSVGYESEAILQAFPAEHRQAALQKLQHVLASLTFVELLFEKGTREVSMIKSEYSWRDALALHLRNRTTGGQQHGDDNAQQRIRGNARATSGGEAETSDDDMDVRHPDAVKPRHPSGSPDDAMPKLACSKDPIAQRFKDLFEQVNGQRNCKELLISDWNRKGTPEEVITASDATRMLNSLGLKSGVMTHNQEEQLALLVKEYGWLGTRAYKRIADALTGGFSVAAVKKNMSRLRLSLVPESATRPSLDSETSSGAPTEPRQQLIDDSSGIEDRVSCLGHEDNAVARIDTMSRKRFPPSASQDVRRSSKLAKRDRLAGSAASGQPDEAQGEDGSAPLAGAAKGRAGFLESDSDEDNGLRRMGPQVVSRAQLCPVQPRQGILDDSDDDYCATEDLMARTQVARQASLATDLSLSCAIQGDGQRATVSPTVESMHPHQPGRLLDNTQRADFLFPWLLGDCPHAEIARLIQALAAEVSEGCAGISDISANDVKRMLMDMVEAAGILSSSSVEGPQQIHICPSNPAETTIATCGSADALFECLGLDASKESGGWWAEVAPHDTSAAYEALFLALQSAMVTTPGLKSNP